MTHKALFLTAASALGMIALAGTAQAQTFANPAVITIPDTGTTPYPSPIVAAGVPLLGGYDIDVSFFNLSHTFPDDLDILLTGPGGFSVMLMSDTGGSLDIVSVNLTFSDGSPLLPDSAQIVSGTFAPTNIGATDVMDAPAPVGPYGTTLNSFVGDPNGTWNLWAVDDLGGDIGSMAGGWSITFSAVPAPGALALLGLAGMVGGRRRRA